MKNMYRTNNVASVVTHYAATGLVAAGTLAIASPWAIGAAVLITGGLTSFMIMKQKELMENDLIVHPDIHKDPPRLGEMVKALYEKTGIDTQKFPVYDFRTERLQPKHKKGIINESLREIFNKAANSHNAAAFNLGKPRIMISEPLLKLLDDDEEYAVLAHEFTHVASYHQHTSIPRALLSGLAVASNAFTMLGAMFTAGLAAIGGAFAAAYVTKRAVDLVMDNPANGVPHELVMSLQEKARAKKIKEVTGTISAATSVGIFTYFNPAYLGLYAATKALNITHRYLGGSFSRSNEFQADRGAVELEANPLALITALRKITIVNQRSIAAAFDGNPPQKSALRKGWEGLFATHPPLEQRMDHLAGIALAKGFTAAAIHEARTKDIDIPDTNHIPRHVIEQMMRVA